MVRYTIKTDEELVAFRAKYIPSDCTARIPEKREAPLEDPREGETGVYAVFFFQAGFKLPLDPLLHRFMWDTGLSLGQISPNAMRVVLGCSELNRRLGVQLTPREIFYCYGLCKCPGGDNDGLYLRARRGMPDLVKCLINSEKDFHKDVICIGGNWKGLDSDGSPRAGIYSYINRAHATPKQTASHDVDFAAINKVLAYNGEFHREQSKHLRAAHLLLGYEPIDKNWLPVRANQPSELGPVAARPSKLKEKGKGKKKQRVESPVRRRTTSEPAVAERVVLGPPGVVTVAGRFSAESEPVGTVLAQSRNKGIVVEVSPDRSEGADSENTASDPEINDWVDEAFIVLTGMPLKRRSLADEEPGSGASDVHARSSVIREVPTSAPTPPSQRQAKRRKTLALRDESITPPHNLGAGGSSVVTPQGSQQQQESPADQTPSASDPKDLEWHPIFEHQGRPMLVTDSPFDSPTVAVEIISGITRIEDVEREGRKSNQRLRNEALQGLLLSMERFAILDNKRLAQIKNCGDLTLAKETARRELEVEVKDKRRQNNILTLEKQSLDVKVSEQTKQIEELQAALKLKDATISDLQTQHAQALEELEKQQNEELDVAEQRGYDTGYQELKAELEVIKGVMYQVGYNFGLDTMEAPENSEHRHPVSIPADFRLKDHLPSASTSAPAPTSEVIPTDENISNEMSGNPLEEPPQDCPAADASDDLLVLDTPFVQSQDIPEQ